MLDFNFSSAIAGVLLESLKREEERWEEEKFHNFRLSLFLQAIYCLAISTQFLCPSLYSEETTKGVSG